MQQTHQTRSHHISNKFLRLRLCLSLHLRLRLPQ
jgi:hypothetical protein